MFAPGYFGQRYWAPRYWPIGGEFIPPEPEPERPEAGGKGRKRRSKYPRRVYIEGQLYWVRNADEERALLRAYVARLQAELVAAESGQGATSARAPSTLRRLIVRAEKRVEAVDSREGDWLAFLRAEDEELLAVLLT